MMTDNPYIIDVTADTFMAEVIEKSKETPILLDFWADWCEPCKNLTPILHDIIEQHPGQLILAKVNTDNEQMLAQQMGVQSLPTVALLKAGQIVDNFMGVKPKSEIMAWLSEHVELGAVEAAPEVRADVQALIDAEQYEEALAALLELPQEQAVWQMIEIHLLMDNPDAAQKLYDGLSEEQLKLSEAEQAKARIQLAGFDANDDLASIKQQITQGQVESAIEALLLKLQQQTDDADVRQLLLSSFSLLNDSKAAAKYRRRMGSLLN